ncbi:MAG: MoaD/ThiS family protein [Candidatus Hodarchaeales archaeon]|jgi:molybdopterin converting factor small subunit
MGNLIHLRLMGAIRSDWAAKNLEIQIPDQEEEFTLKSLLQELNRRHQEKFWTYFDQDWSPKRGTIILINDVDYAVLGGLDITLKPNDQVTFVPTISGG